MASVGSNHSNSRLLGSSHEGRKHCDDREFEMRAPLQPHHKQQNYENMDNFDDDMHQYEDPVRFQGESLKGPKLPARKDRGTPRKKKNDVYESAKRRPRHYTDSSSEDSFDGPARRDPCWQCVRVMVFFIFFLALAALVLIAMIVLGFVPVKACASTSCSPVEVPDEQAARNTGDRALYRTVQELSAKVKELETALKDKNNIIEDLQRREEKQSGRIAKLEDKIPLLRDASRAAVTNVTAIVGPRGPRGFNGSRGAPGPRGLPGKANMSACSYRMIESTPATSGGSTNVAISEGGREKIMSVTCSTKGASEYNMKSMTAPDGTKHFSCECRGTSALFKDPNDKSYCYIHYWTCPL